MIPVAESTDTTRKLSSPQKVARVSQELPLPEVEGGSHHEETCHADQDMKEARSGEGDPDAWNLDDNHESRTEQNPRERKYPEDVISC